MGMAAGRRLTPEMREVFQQPVGRDISESELSQIHAKHIIITEIGRAHV